MLWKIIPVRENLYWLIYCIILLTGRNFRCSANVNLLPVSHIVETKTWAPPGYKCTYVFTLGTYYWRYCMCFVTVNCCVGMQFLCFPHCSCRSLQMHEVQQWASNMYSDIAVPISRLNLGMTRTQISALQYVKNILLVQVNNKE